MGENEVMRSRELRERVELREEQRIIGENGQLWEKQGII